MLAVWRKKKQKTKKQTIYEELVLRSNKKKFM